MTEVKIGWGYKRGVPDGIRAIYGARLIAPAAIVNSRVDLYAEDETVKRELIDWLNGEKHLPDYKPGHGALNFAIQYLQAARYGGHQDVEHVVYEDERGIIKANCQASHGYVYVHAYMYDHVPVAVAA